MRTDRLFEVLSACHPLSTSFKAAITNELIPLSLPKNFHLLEAPKVAEHAYFLDSGFAMFYSFEDGEKHVDGFWQAGQIILSARSFFEQRPSAEFIQLMEKSDVWCISHASVMQLFNAFPEAHHIYRVLMNTYYEQTLKRIRDMKRLSAVERYHKLIGTFRMIEQVVQQEYIASYLGITPQSLSRIKRQLLDGN